MNSYKNYADFGNGVGIQTDNLRTTDTDWFRTKGAVNNNSTNKITIPTGLQAGAQLMAIYDYASESATYMQADAVNFPKAGRFVLEVLGIDVCDPTTQIHAYIEFPNAKLDANVDISFTTDGNHPFTIQAQQAYCDAEKILYRIIIPDED